MCVRIKDLYAGKPDAKDEINFEGLGDFIKTFVVAEHFRVDSLIHGSDCFVVGSKGTGKTALLFYLDSKLRELDSAACTSFVFFKEEFTDVKRSELESLARRMLSSVTVSSDVLLGATEFEYIWRWLLFKRIIADNEECNRQLFVEDEAWEEFERTVARVKDPVDKRKSILADKIRFSVPFKDAGSPVEVSPEIELDLRNLEGSNYREFMALIDEAEHLFAQLSRTDIPYYIFVDELEAYYGDTAVFFRDLTLIRDLIFTVKRFNGVFAQMGMKQTKMICSVRSEVLNAISRFIVTKELNKVTSGFSVPLNWTYTNTSSYKHPIIQILLKRIAVCTGEDPSDAKKLYNEWFPEKIHGIEPASYILNNSWCKPRDMVRLLAAAKSSLQNNSKAFTQSVFSSLNKEYSKDSLSEIQEELRALYTPEEVETIVKCFTGFRTVFSVNQLKKRISSYFAGSVLDTQFNRVIEDLYRLGFLGNFMPAAKTYHWQHKGDDGVILADEWRLCVHFALHGALSIGARLNYGLAQGKPPETGDVTLAVVQSVSQHYAYVSFEHAGREYEGRISIREFAKNQGKRVWNLKQLTHRGDSYRVAVGDSYDDGHRWNLSISVSDPAPALPPPEV